MGNEKRRVIISEGVKVELRDGRSVSGVTVEFDYGKNPDPKWTVVGGELGGIVVDPPYDEPGIVYTETLPWRPA